MMPTATCASCGERIPLTKVGGNDELWRHDLAHRGLADPIVQLDQVSWQEQFLHAVRAIAVGCEFTTADLHGRIPDPPHYNHWGAAMSVAAHMGLCRPVTTQRSELPSTKGSRLLRWVRVAEVKAA